jgi:hypothetical protein
MADQERYARDRYGRDDRGAIERAGDEVRSWFGDDDAARRRRVDEQRERPERERWASGGRSGWADHDEGEQWGTGSRWGQERSYSSGREYGDRDYGWRTDPDRDRYTAGSRGYGQPPGAGRQDYIRPEYSQYGRDTYGGPYGRERPGTREWSTERWRVPGPFAGRGPRGYQRPDERIREEINDRLTAHGLIDATDVECHVQGGEVTLTGYVDSRAAKHAAEDLAEDVPGVREVHNQLRIRSHASDEGVGRTSVLGLTEGQVQTSSTAGQPDPARSRTR